MEVGTEYKIVKADIEEFIVFGEGKNMSKLRVAMLSLIALVQVLTIVGGFFAYREMSDRYWKLLGGYKVLWEKHNKLVIDFDIPPNPFAPLLPLVLFGLLLTIMLLVNEVRNGKRGSGVEGANRTYSLHLKIKTN